MTKLTEEISMKSWNTILTDAIVEAEGNIQEYDKILKYLSDNYDIRPKGEFETLVSEAWDSSKDRESYLWDPKPWEAGPYIPKTKDQWLKENGIL